jgi:predicted metal-dependent phosphoesterase TrpH
LIDLHTHTTASDGRCSPRELADLAVAAGVTRLAVTDHDTTSATAEIQGLAAENGIDAIPGIEITAVENGADVHVLGYFIDGADAALQRFLATQRRHRITRVEEIAARLARLGKPIDITGLVAEARGQSMRSIGRPQIARAMIAAGHVASLEEAFAQWLGRGCPAFVPRTGASPESVIETIHAARGLASLAHPGRTAIDARLPALRDAGLDALEAFHSDHDDAERARYVQVAAALGLLVSGGSDFHGDPAKPIAPGSTSLPAEYWSALVGARQRHG